MTTQPGISVAVLFGAIRRASELLTGVVAVLEPALERAAAVSAGQLSLLDGESTGSQREVTGRIAEWASEVLEPLERLLGLASASPYLVAQDDIQKRIIRDLREEVARLHDQVSLLRAVALDGLARSPN